MFDSGEFEDNGNSTVTDHTTGLMWQQSGSDSRIKYEEAQAYVDKLNRESRKHGGGSDRLRGEHHD